MVDIALCLPGNGVHGFHRLHRILARRRLAGEHNGGGAIVKDVYKRQDLGGDANNFCRPELDRDAITARLTARCV